MKTEEEKYREAFHKALDLKKAMDDLKPESKQRLINELVQIASFQQFWDSMHRHSTK